MSRKNRLAATNVFLFSLSIFLVSCKKESVDLKVNAENYSSSTTSIKANLVAWYKFTKGSIVDYSGKNNNLTPFNVTLATDYMGRPNNAYYFNGYNSFMQASDSPSLGRSKIIRSNIKSFLKTWSRWNFFEEDIQELACPSSIR